MRITTPLAMCLLAVSGACHTDVETDRAVAPAPTPSSVATPTPSVADARATTPKPPPEAPPVAPAVEILARYGVGGRHTSESFEVAADGAYTLDIGDDGIPPATGNITAAELSRLKAAIAATAGEPPPRAPGPLRSESPPVFGVTTAAGSASALGNDDMPGPWGKLTADLAALMTKYLPQSPFVATLAPDATHLTLRQRSTTPISACFAVAVATVTGRGSEVVRSWDSPPLEPGAAAHELAHGPRVATCKPSVRAPGWTLEIPLAVGPPRRGETLYASVHAIVAGEATTVSAEPQERKARRR